MPGSFGSKEQDQRINHQLTEGIFMNKIRESMNNFVTCTAYRDDLNELIAKKGKTGDVS